MAQEQFVERRPKRAQAVVLSGQLLSLYFWLVRYQPRIEKSQQFLRPPSPEAFVSTRLLRVKFNRCHRWSL